MAGKWLGAWSAVSFATACFYGVLWAVVALRGGAFQPLALAQGYLLHAAMLGIVVALGLLLSTRLNHDAAATLAYVLSVGCLVVVPQLSNVALTTPGWRGSALGIGYYLLPHLELFDMRRRMVHDWGPVNSRVLIAVLAYGVLVTAILGLGAWLAYRRKRFSRGTIL